MVCTLQEYCDLYLGPKEAGPARFYERVTDRWEVCISCTDGQFQQVRLLTLTIPQRCTVLLKTGGRGDVQEWVTDWRGVGCRAKKSRGLG